MTSTISSGNYISSLHLFLRQFRRVLPPFGTAAARPMMSLLAAKIKLIIPDPSGIGTHMHRADVKKL